MIVKQTLSFDGMPSKWFEDDILFVGTKEGSLKFIEEEIERVKKQYKEDYEVDYVVATQIDDKTWIVVAFSVEFIDDAITCKLEMLE